MAHAYSSLSLGAVQNVPDIMPENEVTVSKHPAETIRIFTARFGNRYVYGYQFVWKDGRNTFCNPNPARGMFRTERDAYLHCIGMFRHYREYLSPEAYANICAAEREYLKPSFRFD